MIENIMVEAGKIMDLWFDFISPICTPTAVIWVAMVSGLISLFVILRMEYQHLGRMWALDGIELMVAGFFGLLITAGIYLIPLIIFSMVASLVLTGLFIVLGKLVVLSCKGLKKDD